MVISIINAEYLGDYKIKFQFSDETSRIIDFNGFLSKAQNPMSKKYLDKALFQKFTIDMAISSGMIMSSVSQFGIYTRVIFN